jgi:hypothetical protein
MRSLTDAAKVRSFMDALGRRTRGAGRVYLVGGATAVLYGWRATTVDIDLKMDPEPPGAFEAIAAIKDELDVNVELAAPDQFIPPLPRWQERSLFIARHGDVEFFHYDPLSQALAKLERGYARDLDDVRAMVDRRLVSVNELVTRFEEIRSGMGRYPAIDAEAFEKKVRAFVEMEAKG